MVYGKETSVPKAKDGTEQSRCLIWTDTWFKRNDNWQIIAAQDTLQSGRVSSHAIVTR